MARLRKELPDSDIDIGVITESFRDSRFRESGDILHASKDINMRIETVTLHPEDLNRPFFTLEWEIERMGVDV